MKLKVLILIAFPIAIVDSYKHQDDYKKDHHHYDLVLFFKNRGSDFLDGNLATCTANDIKSGKVTNCSCAGGGRNCTPRCTNQQYGLQTCNTVCDANNYPCGACDIYYTDVCDCEKLLIAGKAGSDCIPGKPWTGTGDPPTWIFRKFAANLITSPVLNTGVEHLQNMPDKDGGWTLGLANMNRATQALAMNSKNSRSRNQIHIHLCPKNSNAVRILSNQPNYSKFTAIPNTNWVCQVTNGASVSTDAVNYLQGQSADYIDRAGIGLLTDSNGRLWECVSEFGAAEHIFCV